jgi:hypothetical protein
MKTYHVVLLALALSAVWVSVVVWIISLYF